MDYNAGLKSVENLTNSVMLLPKYIRHKFYRDFKIINSNDREMNLEIIKSCLGERVSNMNNKYTKNKVQRFPKEHCRCRNKITRRFILISFTCDLKIKNKYNILLEIHPVSSGKSRVSSASIKSI